MYAGRGNKQRLRQLADIAGDPSRLTARADLCALLTSGPVDK
jgi:hypothetical protein